MEPLKAKHTSSGIITNVNSNQMILIWSIYIRINVADRDFPLATSTNTNLQEIVTPIKVDVYRSYLQNANFDKKKSEFLVNGFTHGFDIGYRGPLLRQDTAANIPIRIGSEAEMWDKLMAEVKLGRHAGPFTEIPFENYVQSPIGLVPKAGNKTRLIFHLSYDFDKEKHRSINFYTPKEWCTVKYNDLDYAIRTCLNLTGKLRRQPPACGDEADCCDEADNQHTYSAEVDSEGNSLFMRDITEHVLDKIYMSKSDLMSAFRILPVLPSQRRFLILKCKYPGSQKFMFFIEKNLRFGSSISCARFQLFSDSLKCLIEHATDRYFTCTNYLDDYMFISKDEEECNGMVRRFLSLCHEIGCPVSLEKTEWASTSMVFLGVLLNSENHTLSIPEDKRIKALNLINFAIDKKKMTVRFVQQLAGTLNFLNRAIVPGRVFMKGMYEKLKLRDNKGDPLKQYHHVNLKGKFIDDCLVWKQFLQNASAVELCRPFVDINSFASAKELNFYSDASLNENFSFGAIFGDRWIAGLWGKDFIATEKPSIEFLELFALVAALLTWGNSSELSNTRVVIFCDNQAMMSMVNNLASNCHQCMKLIRILTLNNLQFNRRVFVKYVKSKENVLADAISRTNWSKFWSYTPKTMKRCPDSLPAQIWPVTKIWYDC